MTKVTFPLFIAFIIQQHPGYPELPGCLLLADSAMTFVQRFRNCQYNSFRTWQRGSETKQIQLIFNTFPLLYQNIMINLSLSVFGAIQNLKYIRRGLKFESLVWLVFCVSISGMISKQLRFCWKIFPVEIDLVGFPRLRMNFSRLALSWSK